MSEVALMPTQAVRRKEIPREQLLIGGRWKDASDGQTNTLRVRSLLNLFGRKSATLVRCPIAVQ